ncbi:MAG: discoidin domain-containing protein [Fibrobacterales bacterium]
MSRYTLRSWASLVIALFFFIQSPLYAQRANIALNKSITTNDPSPQHPLEQMVDGNITSRWASQDNSGGPWHIIIDLESTFLIDSIYLAWEAAGAEHFTIEVSTDNNQWLEIVDERNTGSSPFKNRLTFSPVSAQYIKINFLVRSTIYGYSLYEAEVYGETPHDYVASLEIDGLESFLTMGKNRTYDAAVFNGQGAEIPIKSSHIKWSLHEPVFESAHLSTATGATTSLTPNKPYQQFTLLAEYTDKEYSGYTFFDSIPLYINPDPKSYNGTVRCDMVTAQDTCITLDDLNSLYSNLPQNITRIADKDLNICLPEDAVFTTPVNIVFAIDMSGSMTFTRNDPTFLTPVAVRKAIETIYTEVPESKVGFMGFSGGVCTGNTSKHSGDGYGKGPRKTEKPSTTVSPKSLDQVQLDSLYSQTTYNKEDYWFNCGSEFGGTSYTEAFTLATEWLEPLEAESINNSIIIFFTDGDPESDKNFPQYVDAHDSSDHPKVYTVALQSTINDSLEIFIKKTKGSKILIDDDDNIDGAIQEILKNAISSITPGNFTVANNTHSYTTTNFSLFTSNDKMYTINGELIPLTEDTNTVTFQAVAEADTSSAFSATLALDISGTHLTTIGRQSIAGTPFDAVCYESAAISVTDQQDSLLNEITFETNQLSIALSTPSSVDEPTIIASTTKEREIIQLDTTRLPYSSISYSVEIVDISHQENSAFELQDSALLAFFWRNPLDPRDSAAITIPINAPYIEPIPDPEPIRIPKPEFSWIYDANADGAADRIVIAFDTALTLLPTIVKSIHWPSNETRSITASEDHLSFYTEADSTDYSKIVVSYHTQSPFEKGITQADVDERPNLTVLDQEVTILDRIGPIIIDAKKSSSNFERYAVQHMDGTKSNHIKPDTLRITLSEAIVFDDTLKNSIITVTRDSTNAIPTLAAPPYSDDGIHWTIYLEVSTSTNTILVNNHISLNPAIAITDSLGNKALQVERIVTGLDGVDNSSFGTFREAVVQSSGSLSTPTLTTIEVPVYSESGELISGSTELIAIPLAPTWVPPVTVPPHFSPQGDNSTIAQTCTDTETAQPFIKGCLASYALLTQEAMGPYTTEVFVYNNLGQFVTHWKQYFGYCGEFENDHRIAQTTTEGAFINDLIWDLTDDADREVASGVYFWKIIMTFKSGQQVLYNREVGVLNDRASCASQLF